MEWTRGPTVGRGSTATVSLATTVSGDLFAVKSSDFFSSSFLQREQHFLSQLNSPYIIEYMGFDVTYENNNPMYNLFLEYVAHGTLSDAIKKQGGSLDEPTIRSYASQMLKGLNYLHSNGLVHCDIKPQNVLIGKNGAKIADLGCAKMVEDESKFSGTPVFMAPEVARGEEQGFPADVWALGCTIIEMATGSNPWSEIDDPVSALYKIGYSGGLPEFPSWFSGDAKDFLGKCLKRDAKDRWTAEQLLEHTFLCNLKSGFVKAEECIRDSPTCVLEQCFWDSLEVPETCRNSTSGGVEGLSLNSPAERFRGLIGGCLANWADEDWVTVRTNYIEENIDVINPDEMQFSHIESSMSSLVNVQGYESSIESEDFLLECSIDDIRCIDDNSRIDPLFCERIKDVLVSSILNFEKQINKKVYSSIQFIIQALCILQIISVLPFITYELPSEATF